MPRPIDSYYVLKIFDKAQKEMENSNASEQELNVLWFARSVVETAPSWHHTVTNCGVKMDLEE